MKLAVFCLIAITAAVIPAMADCAAPREPVRAYLLANPGWRLRQVADFADKDMEAAWRQADGDACPGMAVVDLDGKGPSYALLLEQSGDAKRHQKVILVGLRAGKAWQKIIMPVFASPVPLMVVRVPPGRYRDTITGRTVNLAHDGLVSEEMDAGALLYYSVQGALRSLTYSN